MKAYKRVDFIKLPAKTIYSRLANEYFQGLYCKTTGPDEGWGNDWVEVNLISEFRGPAHIKDGGDIIDYFQQNCIEKEVPFETDLTCGGRDGCFDDSDIFIVWDRDDIARLVNFLIPLAE
jgi:hypothetical protein